MVEVRLDKFKFKKLWINNGKSKLVVAKSAFGRKINVLIFE